MTVNKEIYVICSWRENCNKKFSISAGDVRCPNFVKDLGIKEEKPVDSDGEKGEKK